MSDTAVTDLVITIRSGRGKDMKIHKQENNLISSSLFLYKKYLQDLFYGSNVLIKGPIFDRLGIYIMGDWKLLGFIGNCELCLGFLQVLC